MMNSLQRRYRLVLGLFIVGLLLSGITAFPLLHELRLLGSWLGIQDHANLSGHNGLAWWIGHVWHGLEVTDQNFPFIAYGTDWLAFGHIMIAFFFVGAWREPIANAWVLRTGLVCCAAVFPLALICGEIRVIPLAWRLIDRFFGFFGAIPLLYCLRLVNRMRNAASAC